MYEVLGCMNVKREKSSLHHRYVVYSYNMTIELEVHSESTHLRQGQYLKHNLWQMNLVPFEMNLYQHPY